ncbi:MAG: acetate/propionate family kinase [Hyphococcus sp.]
MTLRAVVTLNAGSSSVKAAIYKVEDGAPLSPPIVRGHVSGIGDTPRLELEPMQSPSREATLTLPEHGAHTAAIDALLREMIACAGEVEVAGVGHRVVHGGADFFSPAVLTADTIRALEALTPLAPKHQPHNLAGVRTIETLWPGKPQIACFDTAFHRTQPAVAQAFALSRSFGAEGIIRYGFHGLSYEYIAEAASAIMDADPQRMIVAHLGAGASMCAIENGQSVATSMGFTALDGLPMATRSGAIDPGVLLYLMEEKDFSASALSELLYERSGLLGLSGISGDMRVLEASDEASAKEAIDYFVYHCAREAAALAAAMGGVDALVFTAGIGENSRLIRRLVLERLGWLGFALDESANEKNAARITRPETSPSAWVIQTNEEIVIARHTCALITD